MDKKNGWLVARILTAVLIFAVIFTLGLFLGEPAESTIEPLKFPFATFFVIFIVPSIIAAKKERDQKKLTLRNQIKE